MSEAITWAIATAALMGTWLNVKKDSRCFWIWCVTNGYWAAYDTVNGLYAQAALFVVYFIISVVGIIKWRVEA